MSFPNKFNYVVGGLIANRYEVVKTLAGGMGAVYFCHDHETDFPIALKTFQPKFLSESDERDQFLREGDIWVQLGYHPHIVFASGVQYVPDRNEVYLILEWVTATEGKRDASLRAWLTPGRPLPSEQALLFALHIARGMKYATTRMPTLAHRDLKPDNVLIGRDGNARVTDFGLAKVLDEVSSRGGGTWEYMAPEQWERRDIDQRADIYALGCILVEMLTGKMPVSVRPRQEQACRELHQSGQALKAAEGLPEIFMPILKGCLAVDPNDRCASWAEVESIIAQVYQNVTGKDAPAEVTNESETRAGQVVKGWSYNSLGLSYRDMSKYELAIKYFERTVQIGQAVQERELEGAGLGNLGNVYVDLGDAQHAIGLFELHLAIAQETGHGEGNALGNLGRAYQALGQTRRAIGFYEQQLIITRANRDRRGEQQALNNLGIAYQALGELRKALEFFEQSLAIAQEIGNRQGEGLALGNIGTIYLILRDAREAIRFCKQHLAVSTEIVNPREEAAAWGNLGIAYRMLDDTQQAIEAHQEALVIARKIGDRASEGRTLGNLGSVYLDLGDVQQAINFFEERLIIAQEIGDQQGESNVLINLGNAYVKLGEAQPAFESFQQALTIAEKIEDIKVIALANFRLGWLLAKLKLWVEALPYAELAVRLYTQMGNTALLQQAQTVHNHIRGQLS